jgi:hypothetical protein
MAQTAEMKRGPVVGPMTLQQRKERGFCTCPAGIPYGSHVTSASEPCQVHPTKHRRSADDDRSRGLLFYDESRNRYVTWEDLVEGMRQPRYAGASSPGLVLFTWMNLMRLLEALRYPIREATAEISEESAAKLTSWAGQNFPPDVLRNLISFARGGGSDALCKIFRTVAHTAQREIRSGSDAP